MSIKVATYNHTDEYVLVHPDGSSNRIPLDPVIFDMIVKGIYKSTLEQAAPNAKTPINVSLYTESLYEYSDLEVFKTKGRQRSKAVFDLLCGKQAVERYKLELDEKKMFFKDSWQSKMAIPADIPAYSVACAVVPAKLTAFVEARFKFNKAFYEQVAWTYAQIIKVIETHFKEPVEFNQKLNQYYVALLAKLQEYFQSDIRATLFEELTLPFKTLFFHQQEVAEIKQDIRKITNPMQDNLAGLQRLIDLYSLEQPKDPGFADLEEFLENIRGMKEQNLTGTFNKNSDSGQTITKLTLIRTLTNSSIKIAVNEEYKNVFKVSLNKAAWQLLLRVAEGEQPSCHNIAGLKSIMDYLNSNSQCKLYSNTDKRLTKIIEEENGRIVPGVAMEVISPQALQQRLNKLKSA